MKSIPALAFRRKFGKVIDDVVRSGQPVTVTRANQPLVVIVPAGHYAPAAGLVVREHRLRRAVERLAEWRSKHADRLKSLDPVALIREGRDRR
jgi:prevent-host-death family protein